MTRPPGDGHRDRRHGVGVQPAADVVSSTHNPRVAAARKLRHRKDRAAAGAFLVEGPHAVGEALRSGRHRVRELLVTPAAADAETELLRAAARADVPLTVVADRVAAALADTAHPQGVFAVVGQSHDDLEGVVAARPRLVAVLDRVSDPGNAGTVLRTADAAGADAVLLTAGSVDPYGGKVVRASAGSLFHLPVVTGLALRPALGALREAGLQVLAADLGGDELDPHDPRLRRPTAWVFGTEAHGLDPADVDAADQRVRLPIYGAAESLNLAAAAAVCLYASAHAQRAAVAPDSAG